MNMFETHIYGEIKHPSGMKQHNRAVNINMQLTYFTCAELKLTYLCGTCAYAERCR
jgi:hypothetical protein